jgi:predicted nucleic acid-binding protein
VLAWRRDEYAREGVLAFLSPAIVHPVATRVSRRAFDVMTQLPTPSALTPIDGLVAATAVILKLPLYALDSGRYAAVPG